MIAGLAGVAVVAAIAAGILLFGGSESPPPTAATPYVFSKDGSPQLVMGVPMGAEFGSDSSTGVVLVGATSDPSALTATLAGVPGKAVREQRFGAAVASGDFDKDGLADLAIGVPGKDGVSVLYGLDIRHDWIGATELENRPKLHDFGATLVAADFNHDGYADLAVSAPGNKKQRKDWDTATLHVLFGGRKGLSAKGATSIEQPDNFKEFGLVMAAGDVDGNGSVDLLEGSPGNPDGTGGHLSFCAGGAHGPAGCSVKLNSPTSALAVGKITKDRFAAVVQGDAGAHEDAGELRVWRGGQSWLSRKPTATITQGSGRVPGSEGQGNGFGSAVAVGDVTGDQFADIVVSAPSDEGSGTVSVIPGSGDAPRPQDATAISAPQEIPAGGHFGAGLSLFNWDSDPHPDLFVVVGDVDKLDQALAYYTSRSDGGLNADQPQWGTGLDKKAQLNVPSALYIGR